MISITTPATKAETQHVLDHSTVRDMPKGAEIMQRYRIASVQSWCGRIEDEIACVWGIVAPSFLSEQAYLWLLTTDVVDSHKFLFIRHSQMIIELLLKDWPLITGHVIADQEQSKKWLRLLGVQFGQPEFVEQRPLIPFEIRKKSNG